MLSLWIKVALTSGLIILLSLASELVGGPGAGRNTAITCLVIWVCFQIYHLQKMNRWLSDFRISQTPTGLGTWDRLYSSIYRLARSYERQQAQTNQLLASFRSVTEAMPDGVVALDHHNQIIFASHRAEQHLGLQLPTDQGRNILNLVRHPRFADYIEGEEWSEPLVLHGLPTADRSLQLQLIPYGDEERLLMSRDITQLERLETTRKDFVANVSHELRTPLTVIAGFIETMQELPLDAKKRSEVLETMGSQTQRMQRLIDDLLLLSRLESSQKALQEQRIDMSAMLNRLAHEAKMLSRESHQILVMPLPEGQTNLLLGDEHELASAFGNLVSNAIRYTPAGGEIRLSWRQSAQGAGIFMVEDNGPGIEPQHLSRLTERFYRVDKGRSRETGGTGLGLAIVKHIASRHEAELKIESQVGQGSRFSIVFEANRCLRAQS